jgi:hypothetical protein
MPYGHYTVCADQGGKEAVSPTQTNTGASITVPVINITNTNGSC